MLNSSIPTKFPVPFASSAPAGGIRAIPTTPGPVPGAAALTTGFPPLTFIQPSVGGIPPDGRDVNGILNQLSAWAQWGQAGGPTGYDSAFATSIGGYPRGALVSSTTGHVWYECLADGNLTNPNTGGANWRTAFSAWSAQSWQATGSANAQVLTLSPTPTSLSQLIGIDIPFFSQGTNTSAVTMNINALGAGLLTQANGLALGAGALVANGSYTLRSNGIVFHVTSQIPVFSDAGIGGVTVNGTLNTTNGANLALIGPGGTTPNKFIRAMSGALQFINSAYGAIIATLSDAGALSTVGSITAGGPILSTSGDITSAIGRLRAGVGAYQSGDQQAATLLADFATSYTLPGYCVFPNGFVVQWGNNLVPGNSTLTVNYALTFPVQAIAAASVIGATVPISALPATINIRGSGSTASNLQISNANSGTIAYDWIVVGH